MRKYVFEITLTDEDLMGDEMWEDMERVTNTDCIAELTEALQQALTGDFTLMTPGDERAKEVVKLKSFNHE